MLQVRGSDGKTVVDGRVLGIESGTPRPWQRLAGLRGRCTTLRQHPFPLGRGRAFRAGTIRLGGSSGIGQTVGGRQKTARHGLLLQQIRDTQGIVFLFFLLIGLVRRNDRAAPLLMLLMPVTVERLAVADVISLARLRATLNRRRRRSGEGGARLVPAQRRRRRRRRQCRRRR